MSAPAYPPVIAAALLKAQRAVQPVEGRGKGWDDRGNLFRFALAEDVIEAARGPLLDAGLMFMPADWVVEERGTTAWVARPVSLIHESGAYLSWTVRWPLVPGHGRPMDKAIAAAATTSLAYALRDLLQIPRPNAGDDVDDRSRNATPSASPPSPKSPQADRDAKPPNITIRPWKCRLTSRNGDREERTAATPEAAAVLLMQGVQPDWGPKGGKRHERVEIETPAGLMAYRMGYDRKTERWQVEADDGAPLPGSSLVEGSEVERALGVETGALFADDSTGEGAREGSSSVQPVATVAAGPSMQAEGTGARPAAEAAEVAHDRPPAPTTRAEGSTRDLPEPAKAGAPDRNPAEGSQAQESGGGPTGPDSAPPATSPLAPTPADPKGRLVPVAVLADRVQLGTCPCNVEGNALVFKRVDGKAVCDSCGRVLWTLAPTNQATAPASQGAEESKHGTEDRGAHHGRTAGGRDGEGPGGPERGGPQVGRDGDAPGDGAALGQARGHGGGGPDRLTPAAPAGEPAGVARPALTYTQAALVEADAKLAADGGRCPDCRDLVDPVPASGARFPCPKCDTTLVVGNDARGERFLAVAALVVGAVMEHVPTGRRLTVLGISGRCVSTRDGSKPEMEAVDAVDLRKDQEPTGSGADWGESSDVARAREEELARQARAAAPTPAEKRKRHVYRGTQACRNCGAAKGAEAPCPGKGATT